MKNNVGKWGIIVLACVLGAGCSSIRSRTDILDHKEWTVYPGVKQDAKEMGEICRGDRTKKPGWVNGMVATILTLDMPFSALFDTVATPYDVYRMYNPEDFGNAGAPSGKNSPENPKKQ